MFFMGVMSFSDGKDISSMTDEQLLLKVADGNEEAFRQLYRNTDRTIYSFVLSIVRNPQDAEEIMQETYLRVWTQAAAYQSQGKPLAWMFTIARNLCYMKFREDKYKADIALDDLEEREPGEICLELESAADRMVLEAALGILKEEERQIVLLHASAGLKHREIASGMQMPLATVLSKYNRAIKKLQQYLREGGER